MVNLDVVLFLGCRGLARLDLRVLLAAVALTRYFDKASTDQMVDDPCYLQLDGLVTATSRMGANSCQSICASSLTSVSLSLVSRSSRTCASTRSSGSLFYSSTIALMDTASRYAYHRTCGVFKSLYFNTLYLFRLFGDVRYDLQRA